MIFIDEIDSVLNLKFSVDGFFEVLKTCYNKRASQPKYNNLTFALFGVATPYELVRDKKHSPFNIGRAIELDGFKPIHTKPLETGLHGKVSNPKAVLQKVLEWTGGQPFLTQKLCKLIQNLSDPILLGTEAERIEAIVRRQIINNWQAQDEPPHLKVIRDRLLHQAQFTVPILKVYQLLLQQGVIAADESREQTELLLSGIAIKQQGELKIFNRIYQEVFNQEWVEKILNDQRPYAQEFNSWLASNSQKSSRLLEGSKLQAALQWARDKNLTNEDYQFLSASQKSEQRKVQKKLIMATIVTIPLFTLGGGVLWNVSTSCPANQIKSEDGTCLAEAVIVEPKRISSGEHAIFLEKLPSAFELGIEAFQSGNYVGAIKYFKEAVAADSNNPEPKIYLNNAYARQNGSLFVLAAVVSADDNVERSQLILEGVAEAQTQFNQKNGIEGRLLEIIIANDSNDPDIAVRIVKQLETNTLVLGVIGHSSNQTTKATMPLYQEAQIAFVSPTSTLICQELQANHIDENAVICSSENINWRSNSYSAAQALIDTLSTGTTRETVFQNLKSK